MNRPGKNNGIYAAETILKQRTKDGKVWYLMKWKGYSPRFNTWEPEENVLDDRLLKAYRKRLTDSKGKVKRKRSKNAEEEQSDDKTDIDVEVDGIDSSSETAVDDDDSRDIDDPSTSQSNTEALKKCRKRRKITTGETSVIPVENEQENTETKEPLPSILTNVTIETPQIEPTSKSTEEEVQEKPATCLSEDKKEKEHITSSIQPKPAIASVTDIQIQTSPVDAPSCATSSPVHMNDTVETPELKSVPEPVTVQEEKPLENRIQENEPIVHKTSKKHVHLTPKSSNFDFLANSIIITDVTTDRGTVTVKECSAYGDFFGSIVNKSQ